jgi:hypothetical protein
MNAASQPSAYRSSRADNQAITPAALASLITMWPGSEPKTWRLPTW